MLRSYVIYINNIFNAANHNLDAYIKPCFRSPVEQQSNFNKNVSAEAQKHYVSSERFDYGWLHKHLVDLVYISVGAWLVVVMGE